MSTESLLVIFTVSLGFGLVVWLLNRKFKELSAASGQRSAEELRTLHERLDRQAQLWSEHLQGLSRQFGSVSELGRQMRDFQEFLRAPKARGAVGEQVLKDIIEQVLPKAHYEFQYRFKAGQVVDAVIKTDKGLIPVDAKFPLENFQAIRRAASEADEARLRREFARDVKKHIDAIAQKYIQPAEGTVAYALMYVPSETVYYEIIRDDTDITAYASGRGVTLVSPSTFHAILGMFLAALRGQEMAKAAKEMQAFLAQLAVEARRFGGQLELTAKHVSNAKNAVDEAVSKFARLEGRLADVKRLKADNR